ncbi:hypothetical protein DTO271G3_5216 [Paecilomyces variotii]|nr:hypothetical protein DTO271G3_5216 [Paecilomyces variotii]
MKLFLSVAFCIAAAKAQSFVDSLSFGHQSRISPNNDAITGWDLGGDQFRPQILSDKIILTPPYPGHTRGSLWAQSPISEPEWIAEFQFRANGPERGGGNLQLWYTKDGQSKVGTSSIYTVGPFDGLALTVDTHSGRGGSIRGFLNDGTTDYKSHTNVDSLAFGHCDYPYRNLGRPSVLRIRHTNTLLEVTVDDKLCFQTNKVALPAGNTFGVTAATPDTPDSFEVFKFLVWTFQSGTTGQAPPSQQQQGSQQPLYNQQDSGSQDIQDKPASYYTTSAQQFEDLHVRLQLMSKASNTMLREITGLRSKQEERHQELLRNFISKDHYANLDARLQRIESLLQAIQRDVQGKDYQDRFAQLQEALKSSHLTLTESLQTSIYTMIAASTPRMGLFVFVLIAFQIMLAGSYIIYKKRRANMPKKFL